MAASSSKYKYYTNEYYSTVVADATSLLFCAVGLIGLLLIISSTNEELAVVRGRQLAERPCDEIYVVGEGETLNTISDKCGDPYIVERNPHIHDPDDVFPGLVIKIIVPV